jgi:hypothetical protein
MPVSLAGLRWWRIMPAAVVAFLGSLFITFLIVTGYAFRLGVEAHGAPDPTKISAFAHQVGPTWGPVLLALFTAIWSLLGRASGDRASSSRRPRGSDRRDSRPASGVAARRTGRGHVRCGGRRGLGWRCGRPTHQESDFRSLRGQRCLTSEGFLSRASRDKVLGWTKSAAPRVLLGFQRPTRSAVTVRLSVADRRPMSSSGGNGTPVVR